MSVLKALWISLLWVALLFVAAGCVKSSSSSTDFSLPSLDGKTIKLSDFRGKVVLVNFWTTWCPACVEEMPLLQAAYEEKASSGLVVLGIDMREDMATVQRFVNDNGITFPIVLDSSGEVSSSYNVYYIPHTVIVDADGNVNRVKVGAFKDKEEILRAVAPLLPDR